MDIGFDDGFVQLVQEVGPGVAIALILSVAVFKVLPLAIEAWKDDRKGKRDHEYRMAKLGSEKAKRSQLDLGEGDRTPRARIKGRVSGGQGNG